MGFFDKVAAVLVIPLMLMNTLGAIIAGIWLAILGEWGAIGWGILMLMVAGIGLGIAMAPGLIFAGPAAMFYERGNKIGFYFFGLLSSLYTVTVLTVWCIAVLYFYAKRADGSSVIPMLLWSYGVATAPIAWLAQKDLQSGNQYAMISTFFAQVGYLIVVFAVWLTNVSLFDVFVLFGLIMLVGMVFQYLVAIQSERLMRRHGGA